jgi:hypothetical protein
LELELEVKQQDMRAINTLQALILNKMKIQDHSRLYNAATPYNDFIINKEREQHANFYEESEQIKKFIQSDSAGLSESVQLKPRATSAKPALSPSFQENPDSDLKFAKSNKLVSSRSSSNLIHLSAQNNNSLNYRPQQLSQDEIAEKETKASDNLSQMADDRKERKEIDDSSESILSFSNVLSKAPIVVSEKMLEKFEKPNDINELPDITLCKERSSMNISRSYSDSNSSTPYPQLPLINAANATNSADNIDLLNLSSRRSSLSSAKHKNNDMNRHRLEHYNSSVDNSNNSLTNVENGKSTYLGQKIFAINHSHKSISRQQLSKNSENAQRISCARKNLIADKSKNYR